MQNILNRFLYDSAPLAPEYESQRKSLNSGVNRWVTYSEFPVIDFQNHCIFLYSGYLFVFFKSI